MVSANEGMSHRGQAALFYRKPWRSQPLRARDIVGKLMYSKPQWSRPTRAQNIVGKLCCWWVAVMQKALMGRRMTMPKLPQQEYFFCWESDSTCINHDTKVDVIGRSRLQKSIAQEGDVHLVNGAQLKRVSEVE